MRSSARHNTGPYRITTGIAPHSLGRSRGRGSRAVAGATMPGSPSRGPLRCDFRASHDQLAPVVVKPMASHVSRTAIVRRHIARERDTCAGRESFGAWLSLSNAAAVIGAASIARPTSTVIRLRLDFIVGYLYLTERALTMPSSRFGKLPATHLIFTAIGTPWANSGCTNSEIKKRKTSTERTA